MSYNPDQERDEKGRWSSGGGGGSSVGKSSGSGPRPVTRGPVPKMSAGRMSYKPGTSVRVAEGAGLESGKHGDIIHPPSQDWIKKNEPGRYKPFDSSREVVIREHGTGRVFTMFKSYLSTDFKAASFRKL